MKNNNFTVSSDKLLHMRLDHRYVLGIGENTRVR